jgi:anti-sigma factor ChrR (cupin superfamily)
MTRGEIHLNLATEAKPKDNGSRFVAEIPIGDADDPNTPRVLWSKQPPGRTVNPHTHAADYMEVILEGSQKVGKTWHHAGDARIVRAGTGYGPLVAGPEGCTVLVIFPNANTRAIYKGSAADKE